jgi:hypothetical protein
MDREAANVRKTPGHPAWIGVCRRSCPSQGGLDGQMIFTTALDERQELSEEFLGSG